MHLTGAANSCTGTVVVLRYSTPSTEDEDATAPPQYPHPRRRHLKRNTVVITDPDLLADQHPSASLLHAIDLCIDGIEKPIQVRRTHFDREWFDGRNFVKSTFPMMLVSWPDHASYMTRHSYSHLTLNAQAWSMTGHRSQGAAIHGPVVIDVRSGFVPGLLCVILSRVKSWSQIYLVGRLTAYMFEPINVSLV